ncbi:hypothetical protein ACFL0Q_03500 [Thermodesulfobacteriota bacterium]
MNISGTMRDAAYRTGGEKPTEALRGLPVKETVRTPAFWLFLSIYTLQLMGLSGVTRLFSWGVS